MCVWWLQQQKKDQSKFYGELLEKRRTDDEKTQAVYVHSHSLHDDVTDVFVVFHLSGQNFVVGLRKMF